MKCAFILLSLVALGLAVPLVHRDSIRVVVADDDTISIYGISGNKLVISKVLGHSGPWNVEIFMGDWYGTVRRVFLDQETRRNHHVDTRFSTDFITEADILVGIFKHYQGDLDMTTYYHLLEEVHDYCRSGHVDLTVYHILKCTASQVLSWDRCVSSAVSDVSSEWYSLHEHLGLERTGSEYERNTHNDIEGLHSYGWDYVTGEPRNYVGKYEYSVNSYPDQYYSPAHHQSTHNVEGYKWQQPMYHRNHQIEQYPHQLNRHQYYYNYVNTPYVY